jgi:hypothetical protein
MGKPGRGQKNAFSPLVSEHRIPDWSKNVKEINIEPHDNDGLAGRRSLPHARNSVNIALPLLVLMKLRILQKG